MKPRHNTFGCLPGRKLIAGRQEKGESVGEREEKIGI
jgi:hypothetical protein